MQLDFLLSQSYVELCIDVHNFWTCLEADKSLALDKGSGGVAKSSAAMEETLGRSHDSSSVDVTLFIYMYSSISAILKGHMLIQVC